VNRLRTSGIIIKDNNGLFVIFNRRYTDENRKSYPVSNLVYFFFLQAMERLWNRILQLVLLLWELWLFLI